MVVATLIGTAGSASSVGTRPPRADAATATLIAVGDLAKCGSITTDSLVAAMISQTSGTIAVLGDNAYNEGSAANYRDCFDPLYKSMKSRIKPVPGNHEYDTDHSAKGYFGYFRTSAGSAIPKWYSYDLGSWHVIALNSSCEYIGGCGPGSAQEKWLRADLKAHPAMCVLAYWHHPLFSSGRHGSNPRAKALFQALYEAHADVVLSGHDHTYERFAVINPSGKADSHGIRQFVVGTGGNQLYPKGTSVANSQVFNNSAYGALKLTLGSGTYAWEFLKAGSTGSNHDSGSAKCHT